MDFVILETGLGGLYDCTNIISRPLISIITSIGYDHMHILGNTLPEIAYQNSICIEAMKILNDLGYEVSEENIRDGLSTVIHKGRLEILKKNPLIIFDGAHNEPAINNFKNTVNMYYKNFEKVYVVSILKSKDYEKILELLLEDKNATFILTSGNDEERYVSANELKNVALKYKSDGQNVFAKSLNEAIEFIMKSDKNVVNFIVGSFYVYGTVFDKICL